MNLCYRFLDHLKSCGVFWLCLSFIGDNIVIWFCFSSFHNENKGLESKQTEITKFKGSIHTAAKLSVLLWQPWVSWYICQTLQIYNWLWRTYWNWILNIPTRGLLCKKCDSSFTSFYLFYRDHHSLTLAEIETFIYPSNWILKWQFPSKTPQLVESIER